MNQINNNLTICFNPNIAPSVLFNKKQSPSNYLNFSLEDWKFPHEFKKVQQKFVVEIPSKSSNWTFSSIGWTTNIEFDLMLWWSYPFSNNYLGFTWWSLNSPHFQNWEISLPMPSFPPPSHWNCPDVLDNFGFNVSGLKLASSESRLISSLPYFPRYDHLEDSLDLIFSHRVDSSIS